MHDPPDRDAEAGAPIELVIPADQAGERLDKALAAAAAGLPGLSRARLAALIAEGALADAGGATVRKLRRKVKPGERFRLTAPPPRAPLPEPEAIPLAILHEDRDLVVVDKPAGMVVHPAPGAAHGTLVNALLHHCGPGLTGIGDARRPGIVHRIDKDTSGLLVVAKTAAAEAGLAAQFARHAVERGYLALAWGAPDRADPRLAGLPGIGFEPGGRIRIETRIARHPRERKRMAVAARGGRRAVTRLALVERFGPEGRPVASLLDCRLETGRTHQIRLHAAHIGHGLIGDPLYGRARALPRGTDPALAAALAGFPRQALHAGELGFRHPVSGESLFFSSPLPQDMIALAACLRRKA